jgi:aspartate ammonia-lyase
MGWSVYKSIKHLSNACLTLNEHCVAGIEANVATLSKRVRESITLVTALNPIIGYEKAALIAKTAIASGKPVDEVAQALGIMTREQVDALLVPEKLTQPLRLKA